MGITSFWGWFLGLGSKISISEGKSGGRQLCRDIGVGIDVEQLWSEEPEALVLQAGEGMEMPLALVLKIHGAGHSGGPAHRRPPSSLKNHSLAHPSQNPTAQGSQILLLQLRPPSWEASAHLAWVCFLFFLYILFWLKQRRGYSQHRGAGGGPTAVLCWGAGGAGRGRELKREAELFPLRGGEAPGAAVPPGAEGEGF